MRAIEVGNTKPLLVHSGPNASAERLPDEGKELKKFGVASPSPNKLSATQLRRLA